MGSPERYLMCPPEFFQVDYVINPWMEGNIDRANGALAAEQWHRLHVILSGQGKIDLITPLSGSPDMVFTANAGLVLGDDAVLSRFLHPRAPIRRTTFSGLVPTKWIPRA